MIFNHFQASQHHWCPLFSANPNARAHVHCRGILCMMWRWWDPETDETGRKLDLNAERRGYCGLSGRPQEGREV